MASLGLGPYNETVKQTGTIEVIHLGRIAYCEGLAIQESLVKQVQEGVRPDTLVLLEHDPVITMGRGAHMEHVLHSKEWLAERGVALYETGRGGDVTYHGPGQLVGYPVLDLARHGSDLHSYLRGLEEVLILALSEFGIGAGREEGLTGVWVQGRKIAAIGIRVQRWVTSHGFALNVTADLDPFDLIIPCGLHGRPVTSMAREAGMDPDMRPVEERLVDAFSQVFGAVPVSVPAGDLLPKLSSP